MQHKASKDISMIETISPYKSIKWSSFNSSLLIEVFRSGEIFTSSAVLIRRNVILTAAHSVDNIEKGYVHIGNEYSRNNVRISFKKVIIHKDYDKTKSNFENDIALIILDKNLPKSITPAKIDLKLSSPGTLLDRLGFGFRRGKNKRTWTNPIIRSFSEKFIELEDNKSVLGDSGGPLYYEDKLVGLHSTKEGTRTYAVRVKHYFDWIVENIPLKEV